MNGNIQNDLQARLYNWFMRKTTPSAVRRVGELPVTIGSDIGIVRGENQDRVAVLKVQLDRNHSFVVVALCDGMGGMAEGTACAAQAIASFFVSCIRHREALPRTRLVVAAQEANKAVHALYQGRGGATLSAVLFDNISGKVGVNVGDSRIYSYRENKLEQLTVDDTLAGVLNKAEDDSLHKNELLQFIGMGDGLEPHTIEMPMFQELMVLTSDGAHYIDKSVMQMVVQNSKEPAMAVKRLIEVSKWCGGRDNASIAIASSLVFQQQLYDETGSFQIWDPFGEIQIVFPDIEIGKEIKSEPTKSGPSVDQAGKMPKKRPVKQQKKTKPDKNKTAIKSQPDDKEQEPPQLKIYFREKG